LGSSPPIRAATFDVGGTRMDPWPSVGHIYAEVAARKGIAAVAPQELTPRFVAAWKVTGDFGYTRADWAAMGDRTFAGLCDRPPSGTFFDEPCRRFGPPAAWKIHDDGFLTLDTLARRGLKRGVIANWDDRPRPLLRRRALLERFDAAVISSEAGCRKPAREIFRRAARQPGLDPGAVLPVRRPRGTGAVAPRVGTSPCGRPGRCRPNVAVLRSFVDVMEWITRLAGA